MRQKDSHAQGNCWKSEPSVGHNMFVNVRNDHVITRSLLLVKKGGHAHITGRFPDLAATRCWSRLRKMG